MNDVTVSVRISKGSSNVSGASPGTSTVADPPPSSVASTPSVSSWRDSYSATSSSRSSTSWVLSPCNWTRSASWGSSNAWYSRLSSPSSSSASESPVSLSSVSVSWDSDPSHMPTIVMTHESKSAMSPGWSVTFVASVPVAVPELSPPEQPARPTAPAAAIPVRYVRLSICVSVIGSVSNCVGTEAFPDRIMRLRRCRRRLTRRRRYLHPRRLRYPHPPRCPLIRPRYLRLQSPLRLPSRPRP